MVFLTVLFAAQLWFLYLKSVRHGFCVGSWSPLLLPLEGRLSREGASLFKLREHYPRTSDSPEMAATLLADTYMYIFFL